MALATIDPSEAATNRRNAEWRLRLHRQLDALCDDVEARKGFHGSVLFEIFWLGRKLERFTTTIKQSVSD